MNLKRLILNQFLKMPKKFLTPMVLTAIQYVSNVDKINTTCGLEEENVDKN